MAVKIEKGVPMPPKNKGTAIYPWDDLKVGESFVVKKSTNGRQLCISASLVRAPKRFESRIQAGITRVWRVQ
jgi:hypothetical protein